MYNFKGFTEPANMALNHAIEAAGNLGHTYIGSEHLLIGLLQQTGCIAQKALQSKGIDEQQVIDRLTAVVGRGSLTHLTPADFTPRCKHILELSATLARSMGSSLTGTEHILLAILEEGESYAIRFIKELGADPVSLAQAIAEEIGYRPAETAQQSKRGNKNNGNTKTPLLDQFGRDLTKLASEGSIDPIIGRSK